MSALPRLAHAARSSPTSHRGHASMSAGASAYGTVPDVRPGTQGDAAAFAMRFDEGAPVAVIDVAGGPGAIAGFRPSDRISDVPTSRNASRHEAERNGGDVPGQRMSQDLITDLVTGHTWQEALSQWERASDLLRRW